MTEVNVLALAKGNERYIFLFDDNNRSRVLQTLGQFADNPELSFTKYDAAVLSQKVRQESQKQTKKSQKTTLKQPPRKPKLPGYAKYIKNILKNRISKDMGT